MVFVTSNHTSTLIRQCWQPQTLSYSPNQNPYLSYSQPQPGLGHSLQLWVQLLIIDASRGIKSMFTRPDNQTNSIWPLLLSKDLHKPL